MNLKNGIKAVILIVWAVLTLPLLSIELKETVKLPKYFSMSYEERKVKNDGPVFRLADVVASLTPPGSAIVVLHEVGAYFRKVAYYSYPRKLIPSVDKNAPFSQLMQRADYLAVFLPASKEGQDLFAKLNADASFEKLYEADGGGLYRIKKGQAK